MDRLKYAPIRPEINKDGEYLNYRTFPEKPLYLTSRMTHPGVMSAQVFLYRWARSDEFIPVVCIAHLQEYLTDKGMNASKRAMGIAVLNSLRYDPRFLKAKTKDNDKARPCYRFNIQEELVYGLEWQLSYWLSKVMSGIETRDDMMQELDYMIQDTDQACVELLLGSWVDEPDWELWFKLVKPEPQIVRYKVNERNIGPITLTGIKARRNCQ